MKMKKTTPLAIAATTLLFSTSATAELIGGIEFPDGELSFADAVISYFAGDNVGPGWDDPTAALGVPDYPGTDTAVSLGIGGELILQFVDNSLTTSGDASPDLHVFEIGGVTEWMNIAISTNLETWIDLGSLLGQPTSIDIDGVAGVVSGAFYSYVRIRDIPPDNQSGYPFGEADIDAVGAISSAPPVEPPVAVPEPSTLGLLGLGLLGLGAMRRRRTR